jgi:hypothetical protein
MTPRFFYDEPRPASVADKMLAEAHSIELKLMRNDAGNVTLLYELKGNAGSELWLDEADETNETEQTKSTEAMDFAGQLLRSFAAGKDGAA